MFNLFLIFCLLIISILFVILKSKAQKATFQNYGIISGIIYNKITEQPLSEVKVYLGKMVSSGKTQSFIKESKYTTKTNANGEFKIEKIELKQYYVMSENHGKKAMRVVKLSKDNKELEGILLKI